MPLKPDTLHDELERQFLSAFSGKGKPGADTPFINASLYGKDRVRVRMRGAGMEMTRAEFAGFCERAIRALGKIGK